jgi:ABC-2 type transport system ATP-binding protein
MIELHQVTKLYKSVIGVNDISLRLEPGTYGLLGPNGSGKTTLINLILGQLRPTLGRVRLFGKNPWTRDYLLRRVGLCPAGEVNYPNVTGFQFVKYLVQLHGFPAAEAGKRAEAALEQVRLRNEMHRPMSDYSLGMRQRAKLAQAIAHEPELLILDEPFNGLDPIGRNDMKRLLAEWRALGRSLILASHILHEVEAINPSFLLLSGGRLLASGSPEDVRAILADTPNTIYIRTPDARKLASILVTSEVVDAADVSANSRGSSDCVIVNTRSTSQLCELLPSLVSNSGIRILEVQSADESLKHLFSTLMKIHRGESRGGIL